MNTSEIEDLLEKFYEGNTSLQEEKILRDFFQGHDVPASLKSHAPIFTYYRTSQHQVLNDKDFELKFSAFTTEETEEAPVLQIHSNRSRLMFITGIAAGVLLFIGLFFTFQHDFFKSSLKQTGSPDTELAYANASEALMMVSGNLNNGLKQMEKLEMVDKAMKNMQLFNKFYQYQTLIINPDEISNQSIKSK